MSEGAVSRGRGLGWLGWMPLAVATVATATALLTAQYGFSFSEGYSYYSFSHVDAVVIGIISQWLAAPLAKLLPIGPVAYRVLPTLLIVGANIVFALGAARLLARAGRPVPRLMAVGFVVAGSLNPLTGTDLALTINYSQFAWSGSSLAVGAALMSLSHDRPGYRRAWILVAGFGLAMVFFGRAPGAATVGLFTIAVMAALDSSRRRVLAEATLLTLSSLAMAGAMLVAFGDVAVYVESIRMTLAHGENAGPLFHLQIQGHGVLNLIWHGFRGIFGLPIVLVLVMAWLAGRPSFRPAPQSLILAALALALAACVLGAYAFPLIRGMPVPPQPVIATCIAAVILLFRLECCAQPDLKRLLTVFAVIGLLLPEVSQIGSAAPIIYAFRQQMGPMTLLLMLAAQAITLARPGIWGKMAGAMLVVAAIFPSVTALNARLDYALAQLFRDGEPYRALHRPDMEGLRLSPEDWKNLVALRTLLADNGVTPDRYRAIGIYEMSSAVVAAELRPFGHITMSDYYQKLACAQMEQDRRMPDERLVVFLTREPDPIMAQCLASPAIGFPQNFHIIGSFPWQVGQVEVYVENHATSPESPR